MPVYKVIRKSDGVELTRYCAGLVVEQINGDLFPAADFDHVELIEGEVPIVTGPRRLTKLQFIDRLGDPAYLAILTMAKTSVEIEAFVKRFEMATPDADGASVDLDDPRTIAGVTTIGSVLEAQSVVTAGWAQGVLA